jgi:protocatechuate 3,4-dioxygenase beta subunit
LAGNNDLGEITLITTTNGSGVYTFANLRPGTYTVNEGDKTVITHVEGSVFPNLIGRDQKRLIVTLTADELKYTNPTTSTGTSAEATWRRVK